ncbi:hypothetical protein DFH06DRAFT_1136250 [Mycena polygramma]|nr:hypothetical protein DFH06DRAFT_1136250 [Mycena polygramma]
MPVTGTGGSPSHGLLQRSKNDGPSNQLGETNPEYKAVSRKFRDFENKWEMGLPAIVNGIHNGITNGISTGDRGILGISVSITASQTSHQPPWLSGFSRRTPASGNAQEELLLFPCPRQSPAPIL